MIIGNAYRSNPDVNSTGGKGFHLLLLSRQSFNVPPFVILPVTFFEEQDGRSVSEKVSSILCSITAHLGGGNFAVRSSAVVEDSMELSFAGQFRTILDVNIATLPQAVSEVMASAGAQHILSYQGKPAAGVIKMAVIIQQMIHPTASGVAFGMNPLTGNSNEKIINAVEGLADQLVHGTQNSDSYILHEGRIEKKSVNGKEVLNEKQLKTVFDQLDQLEQFYGAPQDIEFAFDDNKFYLLQSRPVTAIRKEEKLIWDNSNIVESYPGLTLPLTFSFIEKMYEAVYRQFSMMLGVPETKINRHASIYADMLGLLNGRVYYNLNSWFTALSLLPGYQLNAAFMEKMMGVKERFELDVRGESQSKWKGYRDVAYAIGCILKNLATVRKQKKAFITGFEEVYAQFREKDYASLPIREIWLDYQRFERLMLSRWKAPLVNDFFAMIYFGLLNKFCLKYLPEEKDLHNKLIASSRDIITTEPLKRLPQLVEMILGDERLKMIFKNGSPADGWKALHDQGNEKVLQAVRSYLDDWGERCVAELKLETVTYTQEPYRLVAVMQSYLHNEMAVQDHRDQVQNERVLAEGRIRAAIRSPLKKALFNHVLKNARYLVSNRENLRYYRTQGFGVVRRMMLEIGKKLKSGDLIDADRDVFYLRLPEIEAIAYDTFDTAVLRSLINKRKEEYVLYEQLPLPERIATYGKPGKVILSPQKQHEPSDIVTELQGIPCSAGVVRSKIKLVQAASELKSLDGQVMATYATDPGWVVLFPSAAGILTERGSLLSHAAIVSREMGIPCIVGVEGLMNKIKDGAEIIMDGSTGVIKIMA